MASEVKNRAQIPWCPSPYAEDACVELCDQSNAPACSPDRQACAELLAACRMPSLENAPAVRLSKAQRRQLARQTLARIEKLFKSNYDFISQKLRALITQHPERFTQLFDHFGDEEIFQLCQLRIQGRADLDAVLDNTDLLERAKQGFIKGVQVQEGIFDTDGEAARQRHVDYEWTRHLFYHVPGNRMLQHFQGDYLNVMQRLGADFFSRPKGESGSRGKSIEMMLCRFRKQRLNGSNAIRDWKLDDDEAAFQKRLRFYFDRVAKMDDVEQIRAFTERVLYSGEQIDFIIRLHQDVERGVCEDYSQIEPVRMSRISDVSLFDEKQQALLIAETLWQKGVPPHVHELIDLAPEKMLAFFESFSAKEVLELFEEPRFIRITTEEELDNYLTHRPLIYRLRRMHWENNPNFVDSIDHDFFGTKNWALVLHYFPHSTVIAGHEQDFEALLDRFGAALWAEDSSLSAFSKRLGIGDNTYYNLGGAKGSPEELRRRADIFFSLANGMNDVRDVATLSGILFGSRAAGGTVTPDIEHLESALALANELVGMLPRQSACCERHSENHPDYADPETRSASDIISNCLFSLDRTLAGDERKEMIARMLMVLLREYELYAADPKRVARLVRIIFEQEESDNCAGIAYLKKLLKSIDAIPRQLFEQRPELVEEVFASTDLATATTILKALQNVPYSPIVKRFVAHASVAKVELIPYLPFLELVGCSAFRLWWLNVKEEETTWRDFVEDPRDGADLRDIDLSKREVYAAFFRGLDSQYASESEAFFKEVRFDKAAQQLQGLSIASQAQKVYAFANAVSPKFRKMLFERILLKEMQKRGAVARTLKPWVSVRTGRIDVTQNNLSEVTALLKVLLDAHTYRQKADDAHDDAPVLAPVSLRADLVDVFEEVPKLNDYESEIMWLAGQLDVEEISVTHLGDLGTLGDYLELVRLMKEYGNLAATRYMNNRFYEIDLAEIFLKGGNSELMMDIGALEAMRVSINMRNKVMGDEVVDSIGTSYLESDHKHPKSIGELLNFSRAWSLSNGIYVQQDVQGLYQQYAQFGYSMIAERVRRGLKQDEQQFADELALQGIILDDLLAELQARNLPVYRRPSDAAKFANRIISHPQYALSRAAQKKLDDQTDTIAAASQVRFEVAQWPSRPGVEVMSVMRGSLEVAKVIKCDRAHARVGVLVERDGLVDTEGAIAELGNRYVFSAPMTFTTGNRKLTEFAFRDGKQMNWLLTADGKDGLLLVRRDGQVRILDKRAVKLSMLLDKADLEDEHIKSLCLKWLNGKRANMKTLDEVLSATLQPFSNIRDKSLFIGILREKRLSLLSTMLLINDEEVHLIPDDGRTSRRFFVEYDDGRFGVIDSSQSMTTADLVRLSLAAGVKKALYMDTGMYDMATYRDGAGHDHLMGHPDTSDSTNRVIISAPLPKGE